MHQRKILYIESLSLGSKNPTNFRPACPPSWIKNRIIGGKKRAKSTLTVATRPKFDKAGIKKGTGTKAIRLPQPLAETLLSLKAQHTKIIDIQKDSCKKLRGENAA